MPIEPETPCPDCGGTDEGVDEIHAKDCPRRGEEFAR